MESKKTLILVSVLLVTLIGGASVLYAKLGDNMKPDNLLIQNEASDGNPLSGNSGASAPGTSNNGNTETSDSNNIPDGNGTTGSNSTTEGNGSSAGNSTVEGSTDTSTDEKKNVSGTGLYRL